MRAVRLLLLAAALPVAAEAAGGEQAEDTLRRCAVIEDDGERLACFDTLAASAVARDAGTPAGLKRYGTRRDVDDAGRRVPYTVYTPATVHIIGYIRLGDRGRHRYLDSDGRAWPIGPDEIPENTDFPFDAEVIPDPESLGAYRLRRMDGLDRDDRGRDGSNPPPE